MTDALRDLVNQRDRENARLHRLTGKPVLPTRDGQGSYSLCSACGRRWARGKREPGAHKGCGGKIVEITP